MFFSGELLNPFASIHRVHPDTLESRDLMVFRCSAWCQDPTIFLVLKKLWVVEHGSAVEDNCQTRPVLIYLVSISLVEVLQQDGSNPALMVLASDDGSRRRKLHVPDHGQARFDRSRCTGGGASGADDPGGRRPVHERLEKNVAELEESNLNEVALVLELHSVVGNSQLGDHYTSNSSVPVVFDDSHNDVLGLSPLPIIPVAMASVSSDEPDQLVVDHLNPMVVGPPTTAELTASPPPSVRQCTPLTLEGQDARSTSAPAKLKVYYRRRWKARTSPKTNLDCGVVSEPEEILTEGNDVLAAHSMDAVISADCSRELESRGREGL